MIFRPLRAGLSSALAAITAGCALAGGCSAKDTLAPADAGAPEAGTSEARPDAVVADAPAVDWVIALEPATPASILEPALLGQYDLSGALYRYDQVPKLPALMKAAGLAEWRVGVGRWEIGTLTLPALTDGTPCDRAGRPLPSQAPAGTTDLDLIQARDWFTYTDGAAVTVEMTASDSRYHLDYVRSVLDVVTAFGATAYVGIDHMPRALAANQTPVRTRAELLNNCDISWANKVSNVRPADPAVLAAAVVGLVKRVVEGSGGAPGRPVRYWELWNEPELDYAWDKNVGDMTSYFQVAAATLAALDAYRKQTSHADGKAIRIGLGSFADGATAATVLKMFDAPFDFVSFHEETDDDPLVVASKVQDVADARKASRHPDAELHLTEWTRSLGRSTLDPTTIDVALHHATVLALGAAAGIRHAHHAIFWNFLGQGLPPLGIIDHDGSPLPAYHAYVMLAQLIGSGSSRLSPIGHSDGRLDGGAGAVLASKDAAGKVRVLFINRGAVARTARVDLPSGAATPTKVRALVDPKQPPADVAPSTAIVLPARSIVLVEL